ncbi:MAG: CoA transferase [Pseudomonadota bacterium]|nr:CoA transferase [Pseudomonadota bacterium]
MSENLLLKGIKVIDAASFIAGPASTTILSDFGAEVIKIEPPKIGDSLRHLIMRTRRVNPQSERDYCWHLTSRNKKSLALDLNSEKGQEILRELIKDSDVFVTNMPEKTRQKLKIRAEDLLPINDRLVYGSLTGYGENGEDSHRTAFDVLAWWARSGLMDVVRPSDNSSPGSIPIGMGDQPSGVALFASIMTALYRREKTGKGGEVYTSLMANGAWSNGSYIQAGLFNADFPDRQIEAPLHPFGGRYKTKDGRFLLLAIIDAAKEWPKFLKAMNLEYLNEDEKFSSFKNLNSNFRDLYKILEEQFAQYNLSEVIDKLKNSGVTFGFMNKSNDLSEDQQFLDSEVLIKYDNKAFGDNSLTVNSPVFLKNEPKKIPEKGPELGEHTKQILLSLGKSEQDIKQLKKEGIIDF